MRSMTAPLYAAALAAATAGLAAGQDEPTNQIHYPLDPRLEATLRGADAAARAGRYDDAVELYREALDDDVDQGQYKLALHPGDPADGGVTAGRRFVGVTEWAIAGLRRLPVEGVREFRVQHDHGARAAFEEALAARRRHAALARAYERFPIASDSAAMLETMAGLALERGDLDRALVDYRDLLGHHERELEDPSDARRGRLLAALGLGDVQEVRATAGELRLDDPEREVRLGGRVRAMDDLIGAALERRDVRQGRLGEGPAVTLPRLGPGNAAWTPVEVAFGASRFRPLSFDRPRYTWDLAGGRQTSSRETPARHLPVIVDGTLFVPRADRLLAYDLTSGKARPRIPRLGPATQDSNPKVQFGGAYEQGVLVVPYVERVQDDQQFRSIPIKVRLSIRKLAGFDVARWRWRWTHAQTLRDTDMEGWSFPCAPVAREGILYAPAFSIQGFVNCYAAAFDARTGEPRWTTWIASGQVEQTMFGEHATEPLCVPLALQDGVVYDCTSFGCMAALDAETGRLLWVTEYDQIEVRAPRGHHAEPRRIDKENVAPVVAGDVVVAAPLDSHYYYGFDRATGAMLWRNHARSHRYLVGAHRDRVVLAGVDEVHCIDVQTGRAAWRRSLDRGRLVAGRGVIAGDTVLVPTSQNEVAAFDLVTGKPTGKARAGAAGNVIVCGKHIVIVGGDGRLAVHHNRAF